MNKPINELLKLSQETRLLSDDIAALKRTKSTIPEGAEKDALIQEIKMMQSQALFCVKRMKDEAKLSKL